MLGRLSVRARPALRASQLVFGQQVRFIGSSDVKNVSNDEAYNILVAQRKNRPLSPDLQIYKPQLTWVMSGLHRITGCALGGVLYAYLIGYAALPLVGYTFLAPATVAGAFGALPFVAKFATKLIASLPFTYHSFNGIRHLVWDTVKGLTIPQLYKSGYLVTGLSIVTAVILAVL